MKKELFGEVNGREVYLYTLENSHGMKAVSYTHLTLPTT